MQHTDELPRADTSMDVLAKLKPAFHVKGSVTAGNSSPLSDGAAATVIMSEARAKALALVLGQRAGFRPDTLAVEDWGGF